jgi:hypothetical protein
MKRILCCLFLLLACSSAEASMADLSSPSYNLPFKIADQVRYLSVTNTPINTVQPVCEVLKKKNVTRYSYKQFYFSRLSGGACAISAFFLVVLLLTHSFLRISMGMSFFLLGLYFLSSFVSIHETGGAPLIIIVIAAGLVLTRDCPRVGKVLTLLCLVTLVVSFLAFKLINRNGFSYLDDYLYPEYLVSSTSTNIVVVHEKMELPYRRSYKNLLFRDGRMTHVSTNELATLLQAQADEIRKFRQAK